MDGNKSHTIFQNESGGHQWMRHSPTDSKGRIHTSLITVAVLKVPEKNEFVLDESDCVYRTIRAFGAGGQHSNKTESGVVVKHTPTGIECRSTSDRSQHANKALALDALKSKLYELEQTKENKEISNNRKSQVGSGHRSDKIRTIRVVDNVVKCEITGKNKPLKEYLKGKLM